MTQKQDPQQAMQKLVRQLVSEPDLATEFLMNPTEVAQRLGIRATVPEMDLIRRAVEQLRASGQSVQIGKPGTMARPRHIDFPECEHIEV